MLTPADIEALTTSADAVVQRLLFEGSARMRRRPKSEVGFVAAITCGVPDLAVAWRPLLNDRGLSLALHGVFCHLAPQVEYVAKRTNVKCELADLLIVVDRPSARSNRRIAALVQAKMAGQANHVLFSGTSSKRQLHLYQQWPDFRFVETSRYGADKFDLKNGSGSESGSFGVIDRHFRNRRQRQPVWTQHAANPTPDDTRGQFTLGAYLAHMAAGIAPYGRPARPSGTDDWSKVVDLLLDVTYKKKFSHKSTLGAFRPDRGVTAMAFLCTVPKGRMREGNMILRMLPPFGDGIPVFEDDEPSGISVLHLTLKGDES